MKDATYLGDGLYVRLNRDQYEVFAHNGVEAINTVYLDPHVLEAFLKFVEETRVR
jgi:hypothetical protein